MKLWNELKERMLSHPDREICEDNAQLTFEDAVIWAELFAEHLKGFRCCAILCQSEMAAAMALLACFAADVTAVPLSERYGALHCNQILDVIRPDAVLTDMDGEMSILKITDNRYLAPDKPPALIMCTSGTTGKPKGVMLTEQNVLANVSDIARYFAIGASDTILISRPLYHCAVLTGEFLIALVKGTSIRFYSGPFDPAGMLGLTRKWQITAFCGTPTLLSVMARFASPSDSASLRHICVSGECMGREVGLRIADAFPGSEIYHVYGLTEACPRVSYLPPELFRTYPDCVGIPLKSVSVRILNKNGRECSTGEEGVLWVKGDNVMSGYYRDPKKTGQVLKNGWLCTGDIAVKNRAGLLKIKGRTDDLIIRCGMNIYPAEVEAAVRQDKRVKEVLVYGYTNRFGTQLGMKIAGNFSSVDQVKRLCAERLPSFQVPTRIEIVPELPKNGSGKIQRRKSCMNSKKSCC